MKRIKTSIELLCEKDVNPDQFLFFHPDYNNNLMRKFFIKNNLCVQTQVLQKQKNFSIELGSHDNY